jgi:hypothetical protein
MQSTTTIRQLKLVLYRARHLPFSIPAASDIVGLNHLLKALAREVGANSAIARQVFREEPAR